MLASSCSYFCGEGGNTFIQQLLPQTDIALWYRFISCGRYSFHYYSKEHFAFRTALVSPEFRVDPNLLNPSNQLQAEASDHLLPRVKSECS